VFLVENDAYHEIADKIRKIFTPPTPHHIPSISSYLSMAIKSVLNINTKPHAPCGLSDKDKLVAVIVGEKELYPELADRICTCVQPLSVSGPFLMTIKSSLRITSRAHSPRSVELVGIAVFIAVQGGAAIGSTRESECIEVVGGDQLRSQIGRLCLGVRGIPLAVVLRGPWEDPNKLPPCTSPIQDKSPEWDAQLRWAAGE